MLHSKVPLKGSLFPFQVSRFLTHVTIMHHIPELFLHSVANFSILAFLFGHHTSLFTRYVMHGEQKQWIHFLGSLSFTHDPGSWWQNPPAVIGSCKLVSKWPLPAHVTLNFDKKMNWLTRGVRIVNKCAICYLCICLFSSLFSYKLY